MRGRVFIRQVIFFPQKGRVNLNSTTRKAVEGPLLALSPDARALELSELAKRLEKAGEYEAGREALSEYWPQDGGVPRLDGLSETAKGVVLMRIGALTGWLGSTEQKANSQEAAKDLLTRSIEIFQSLKQSNRVAEARSDLALCYWREGAFDEARDLLRQVMEELEESHVEARATAMIRSAIVEKTAARYTEALSIYQAAAPLVDAIDDDALKGAFHNGYATLLNICGLTDPQHDRVDQALIEFAAASYHFERAGNQRFRARVENNLGYLFHTIGKFADAHTHLDRARELFRKLGDHGSLAAVEETRARTFLAEGRPKEAERAANQAVQSYERGGEQALLAEALNTHGIVLARLAKYPRARSVLDRAIEIAEQAGDWEAAGRARLSIIEELRLQATPQELARIYQAAAEILERSQDQAATSRLLACARLVIETYESGPEPASLPPEDNWEGFSFKAEMVKSEKVAIERALRAAGGSVTKAAKLLGFRHHQSLISLINNRHKDLLKTRSAVRQRRRHLFSTPTKIKRKVIRSGPEHATMGISIFHVAKPGKTANEIDKLIVSEDWLAQSEHEGNKALAKLTSDERYDLLLLDSDVAGLDGIELTRRVRRLLHRRRIPVVMLSESDGHIETEAYRAGVDAFLKSPDQLKELPSTIARLLRIDLKKRP